MNTQNHKDYIEKEYKKLFLTTDKAESECAPFYHFIMFGSEGLEAYKVVRSEKELSPYTLRNMELRARMNSHRNICGYAFKRDKEVPAEKITKSFLKKAMKIF